MKMTGLRGYKAMLADPVHVDPHELFRSVTGTIGT